MVLSGFVDSSLDSEKFLCKALSQAQAISNIVKGEKGYRVRKDDLLAFEQPEGFYFGCKVFLDINI